MVSLSKITAVLGSKRVIQAAQVTLTLSHQMRPMNMRLLCVKLRGETNKQDVPDSAYDLLDKLLEPNAFTRLTTSKALEHSFYN